MHDRIRQRRASVGASVESCPAKPGLPKMLAMLDSLQVRIDELRPVLADPRIPQLAAMVRSARLVVEISASNNLTARELMPCATATLLHVRSVITEMGATLAADPFTGCESAPAVGAGIANVKH